MRVLVLKLMSGKTLDELCSYFMGYIQSRTTLLLGVGYALISHFSELD